tara:strand:+ start:560 stop:1015 length:456 start_codon:yes stop_codon:yes gene_type:complete
MNTDTFNEMTEEIKADEGVVNEVYLDHLGLPTVGVGHLIRKDDPEHGLDVGTQVDEERVAELFEADLYTCVAETKLLYPQFEDLPAEAQKILCNMMFNMGRPRLSRFHKMKKAVDSSDWTEAANQMLDSRWAKQVPNRANRLIERMKNIQT